MQCVEDDGEIWPTVAKDIEDIEVPEWDLKPGEEVLATVAGEEICATVLEDGCSLSCGKAKVVRRVGGPDLFRSLPTSRLPRSATGQPARPNVLMFGDWGVNVRVIQEQEERFEAWLIGLPISSKLAIVEVGAGKAVPTIRLTAERMLERYPESRLIRINWDDSDVPPHLRVRSVSIGQLGALESLSEIDRVMKEA